MAVLAFEKNRLLHCDFDGALKSLNHSIEWDFFKMNGVEAEKTLMGIKQGVTGECLKALENEYDGVTSKVKEAMNKSKKNERLI